MRTAASLMNGSESTRTPSMSRRTPRSGGRADKSGTAVLLARNSGAIAEHEVHLFDDAPPRPGAVRLDTVVRERRAWQMTARQLLLLAGLDQRLVVGRPRFG